MGEAREHGGQDLKPAAARAWPQLSRADIKNLLYLLIDVVIQFGVEDRKRCIKEIWYDPERKRRGLAAAG